MIQGLSSTRLQDFSKVIFDLFNDKESQSSDIANSTLQNLLSPLNFIHYFSSKFF